MAQSRFCRSVWDTIKSFDNCIFKKLTRNLYHEKFCSVLISNDGKKFLHTRFINNFITSLSKRFSCSTKYQNSKIPEETKISISGKLLLCGAIVKSNDNEINEIFFILLEENCELQCVAENNIFISAHIYIMEGKSSTQNAQILRFFPVTCQMIVFDFGNLLTLKISHQQIMASWL